MTSELMRNLLDSYQRIDPRDRQDTEVHTAATTAREITVTIPDAGFKFEDYMRR